jgi:hypothetical protein
MANHLYTTDQQLDATLIADGYIPEGIACYVFEVQIFIDQGLKVPLYHWCQPDSGDNFYTLDPAGEVAQEYGYAPKGTTCYVFANEQPNTVQFYRGYNSDLREHFYSRDKDELNRNNYNLDGAPIYVFADQQPGTVPLNRYNYPYAGVPITYHTDIKPMFRQFDIDAMMQYGVNLSSYEPVKENAAIILINVQNGSMPCDAPWPPEWVATFQGWIDGGFLP